MKNNTRVIWDEAAELTNEQIDVISNIHLRKGTELLRNSYTVATDGENDIVVLPAFFKRYPKVVQRLIDSYRRAGRHITVLFDGPVKTVE